MKIAGFKVAYWDDDENGWIQHGSHDAETRSINPAFDHAAALQAAGLCSEEQAFALMFALLAEYRAVAPEHFESPRVKLLRYTFDTESCSLTFTHTGRCLVEWTETRGPDE